MTQTTANLMEKTLQLIVPGARSNFSFFLGGSGSEDRGGGDSSIQFINFGRVGDKNFKEWRQKLGGWKGGNNDKLKSCAWFIKWF